jgi:two-component system, response regulator YesN
MALKILVVDDDEIIRKGIAKIIEQSGLECPVIEEASDGTGALELLERVEDIDLLITDIKMPVMDGLELIKAVKEQEINVKIIVLSGFDDFKYVHSAFLYGTVDYLLKPINHLEFRNLLLRIQSSLIKEDHDAKDLKENNSLVLTNLLDRLFHGKLSGNEEYGRMKKFNIDLEEHYVVMITRLDEGYKQKLSQKDYEKSLSNVSGEIENWFKQYPDDKVFLYPTNFEVISLIMVNTETFPMDIIRSLHEYLMLGTKKERSFTTGVGNLHCGWEQAVFAYQEAVEAADIRFYQGSGHCILYEEVHEKCIDMQYDMESNVSLLIHHMELCDYINARHVMDRIFIDLSYLKPHKFRRYMIEILDILYLRVKDFENSLRCNDQDYKFNLDHINTYNELKTYMISILQDSIAFIRSEREKRSKKRIEMAKSYIQVHYMEAITLNDVAEYVELNPSYFSNLFKAELGINFTDFLLDTRMNMAKQYLRNPKIRIYEIGNMVGYEDAVSFGRAFKKKICMSPKEYRNAVY